LSYWVSAVFYLRTDRLNELRHEIDACNRAREQLERLVISIRDESQQTSHRIESLNGEVTTLKGSMLGINSMAVIYNLYIFSVFSFLLKKCKKQKASFESAAVAEASCKRIGIRAAVLSWSTF
jgi:uncharacterized coiled-coil DUF342 family protein